jgi:hypothetical protein
MSGPLTVQAIHIYPVKALHGLFLPQAAVEPWGLAQDRRWMVVQPDGRFLTQRDLPEMARVLAEVRPDGLTLRQDGAEAIRIARPGEGAIRRQVSVWRDEVPALDAGAAAASWLSAALGTACGLVYLDDPTARPVDPAYGLPEDRAAFSDGFPLLLASEASLEALNAELAEAIPMSRFRPNVVISGAPPWAEDRWRRIRIGKVSFRVVKPCSRCVVTTVDQETGQRPDRTEPLKTLARLRKAPGGVMFGQNLIPDGSGEIAIGDKVELVELGRSNVELSGLQGQAE